MVQMFDGWTFSDCAWEASLMWPAEIYQLHHFLWFIPNPPKSLQYSVTEMVVYVDTVGCLHIHIPIIALTYGSLACRFPSTGSPRFYDSPVSDVNRFLVYAETLALLTVQNGGCNCIARWHLPDSYTAYSTTACNQTSSHIVCAVLTAYTIKLVS